MPSTVKVRVKAARNLPVMDNHTTASIASAVGTSAVLNMTSRVGGGGGSSSSNTGTGSTGGNLLSSIAAPSTDAYVLVTLGGHYNLTDLNQEGRENTEKQKCYSAKTKVCRRTLNPTWDEEFRFDVSSDTLLQDEPLIFKVCDSEALSYDESIGMVYVDLNPLLTQITNATEQLNDDNNPGGTKSASSSSKTDVVGGGGSGGGGSSSNVVALKGTGGSSSSIKGGGSSSTVGGVVVDSNFKAGSIDGWFPLYDTLGGVRGELGISVKLNFIGDINPFRDSSAGVQLFPLSTLDPASGLSVKHIFGFVEELVVADDPEYEWNNEIGGGGGGSATATSTTSTATSNFRRAARDSHETRQTLMYLLDAAVRRRMCKTVLEKGGNAVLGYHQVR